MLRATKRGLIRFLLTLAFVALPLGTGCTSYSHGTKVDSEKVATIERGKTTRPEVEAMFGPPSTINLYQDGSGRRMATWSYVESKADAKPESFVPVVGMFAGGARGTSTSQTLQVIYNSSQIVEDYEFSGQSGKSNVSATPFGTSMQSNSNATTQP